MKPPLALPFLVAALPFLGATLPFVCLARAFRMPGDCSNMPDDCFRMSLPPAVSAPHCWLSHTLPPGTPLATPPLPAYCALHSAGSVCARLPPVSAARVAPPHGVDDGEGTYRHYSFTVPSLFLHCSLTILYFCLCSSCCAALLDVLPAPCLSLNIPAFSCLSTAFPFCITALSLPFVALSLPFVALSLPFLASDAFLTFSPPFLALTPAALQMVTFACAMPHLLTIKPPVIFIAGTELVRRATKRRRRCRHERSAICLRITAAHFVCTRETNSPLARRSHMGSRVSSCICVLCLTW